MRMPGTVVAMSLNGLRTSLGALGFGSNVSRWLGPPSSQRRMQDFARARCRGGLQAQQIRDAQAKSRQHAEV